MTKIDIISGFLGAGKTTFIKKMLEEVFSGEKVVLVENEYGEVGIDGGFLKDAGIEIKELNSGCICCSLVGDFNRSLNEVIETYHPDRILIEPSGVGKLSDVMSSVKDMEKDHDVKLNALVTVVNAMKASKQMKAFGEFFNNQIANATTIVLSRTQNAKEEKLELCVKEIQAVNPKAAIITTPWDAITGEQILNVVEQQDSLMQEMMKITMSIIMTTSMTIIMTMSMSIIMSMSTSIITTTTMITIMTMVKDAPVDAMTMIIIITIMMQMKYLQVGAKRLRINIQKRRSSPS